MAQELKRVIYPDLIQYGERLNDYLLALPEITKSLSRRVREEVTVDNEIDEALKKTLPLLKMAFASNLAFIADENGKVIYATPEENYIVGKLLPAFPSIQSAIKNEGYIAIDKTDEEKYKDLYSSNLFSLLAVLFETPAGKRYVGVANGEKSPPYINADKTFLDELMKIHFHALLYSKEKEQRHHLWGRYHNAQYRGDWEYLLDTCKHYITTLLYTIKGITGYNGNRLTKLPGQYDDDTILTDYLDALLCHFIHSTLPRSKGDDPIDDLLVETETFLKSLGNNESEKSAPKEGNGLRLEQFQRTVLAVARIRLFIDNFKRETSSPGFAGKEKKQELATLAEEIWSEVFKLFKEDRFPDNESPSEWRIDWLRTKWQQIYYLSRRGMLEPGEGELKRVNEIYKYIWEQTVRVIKDYLENKSEEADLCIDSDWLITWLAGNVLLSKRLKAHYDLIDFNEKKLLNPIAKMRYLKHLSHHILYVLHCVRFAKLKEKLDKIQKEEQEKDPQNTKQLKPTINFFKRPPFADILVDVTSSLSEAQLFLISEYAYREIGLNRELRIFERLSRQLSYELPLYAASNFYRDHLYHVMDVCLLGELLLCSLLPKKKGKKGGGLLANIFPGELLRCLLYNWYVTALCHDLGYVIEQSEKFLNPISKITGEGLSGFSGKLKSGVEDGKEEIRKTIDKIVKSHASAIPPDLACKLIDDIVPTDHGVAAWLHLQQWMKDVKSPLESLAPALNAILRHNLSDQKIDLHQEPLSFLLMLCDHIQEWGRPRVGPEPLARGIMEGLRFAESPELDRKVRMSKILVTGLTPRGIKKEYILAEICDKCVLKGDAICKTQCLRVQTKIEQERGLEFVLPHVEAREADFEPCISWLMFSRDLQSIDCRKLPFRLSIIMKHTPPRIWHAFGWNPLEMDIFEEFAGTYPTATYLLEWIESARGKKKGIEYDGNRGEGTETFTINLNDLDKPLKRDLSDEHWKDFFRWKWQWLSHKYTTSNLGIWFPENK